MITKHTIATVSAILITASTLSLTSPVYAASEVPPYQSLVQKIAQTFQLDVAKVQALFDQFRQTRQEERSENRQEKLSNRLSRLVQEGKITESQKTAIIQELALLDSKYPLTNWNTKTKEERKNEMQARRTELESWAKSHNIDLTIVEPGFRGKALGRPFGQKGYFHKVTPTP